MHAYTVCIYKMYIVICIVQTLYVYVRNNNIQLFTGNSFVLIDLGLLESFTSVYLNDEFEIFSHQNLLQVTFILRQIYTKLLRFALQFSAVGLGKQVSAPLFWHMTKISPWQIWRTNFTPKTLRLGETKSNMSLPLLSCNLH